MDSLNRVLWAQSSNDNNFGSSSVDLNNDVWKAGYDLVFEQWDSCSAWRRILLSSSTPRDFIAFFDDTQEYIEIIDMAESEQGNRLFDKKEGGTT